MIHPPPEAPPRRGRRLAMILALAAAIPFGAVFMLSAAPETTRVTLSEADRALLSEGMRLIRPRLAGRTPQGEPYALSAAWAEPDGPRPKSVTIGPVVGRLDAAGGRRLDLKAGGGLFLTAARGRLTLDKGVRLESSDGYWAETDALEAISSEKRLRSLAPVRGAGPMGEISADSLEVLDDGGRVVLFKGRVRMTLRPAADKAPERAPDQETQHD